MFQAGNGDGNNRTYGITWVELYFLFLSRGGLLDLTSKASASPLITFPLRALLNNFKRVARCIVKNFVEQDDQSYFSAQGNPGV